MIGGWLDLCVLIQYVWEGLVLGSGGGKGIALVEMGMEIFDEEVFGGEKVGGG